jgi:RHS repeat-associated protein
VNTTTPIDATNTMVNPSGTPHTSPSATTTGTNRLGITVVATNAITTMTPPSGSTERVNGDQAGGTTTPTVSIETSDFPQTAAAATGTKISTSAPAAISTTATITLQPPATAVGPITYTTYYQHAGETIGYRQYTPGGTSTLQWMIGNHQSSAAITMQDGTTTPVKNRYLPYGGLRGADAINTTDRGFLNQIEDATTGLDYLNNRYLDPALGRFISVDPLVAMTHSAYGYASNNPISRSDPSGLCDACLWSDGVTNASRAAQASEFGPVSDAHNLETNLGLCRHMYSQCASQVNGNKNHPLATAVGYYSDLLLRGVLTLDKSGDLASPLPGVVFGVGAKLVGIDLYEISISFGDEVPPAQLRAGLDVLLSGSAFVLSAVCTAGTEGACGPALIAAGGSVASSAQAAWSACHGGEQCGLNVGLLVVNFAATATPFAAEAKIAQLVKAGVIGVDTAADLGAFVSTMANAGGGLNSAVGLGLSPWVSGVSSGEVVISSFVRNVG